MQLVSVDFIFMSCENGLVCPFLKNKGYNLPSFEQCQNWKPKILKADKYFILPHSYPGKYFDESLTSNCAGA